MKRVAPTPSYVALTRLWHTKEARHVEAGEAVDLSHLDSDAINKLLEVGAVELKPAQSTTTAEVTAPTEATDGTDNRSD